MILYNPKRFSKYPFLILMNGGFDLLCPFQLPWSP